MLSSKLKSIVADARGDQIFTTNGSFTVPAGVTSVCIAIVPGDSISSISDNMSNIILSAGAAFISSTQYSSGSMIVPAGPGSIQVVAKGGDAIGNTTYSSNWALTLNNTQVQVGSTNGPSTNIGSAYQAQYPASSISISYNGKHSETGNLTINLSSAAGGVAYYTGPNSVYNYLHEIIFSADFYYQYTRQDYYNTVWTPGTNTTASINLVGTLTYDGASTGSASSTTRTMAFDSSGTKTLNYTIGSANGWLYYTYSAFAFNHTATTSGSGTYNITGNIVSPGPYSGNIAAWRNSFTVTPGQQLIITVASGGAVRIMWGNNRSFPSNAL